MMTLATDQEVRLLEIDGRVSEEVYRVVDHKQAKKGHLDVVSSSGSELKVAARRVLPLDADQKAPVTNDGNYWYSHCPTCGTQQEIDASSTEHVCDPHGRFQLLFLGDRPMATTANATKATKAKVKKKKPGKDTGSTTVPKEKRPVKAKKDVTPVDFEMLQGLPNCELWTKGNVKFDHPSVSVASHVLLYVGDPPRKLCFNTYNGGLGKKNNRLAIEEFLADKEVEGVKDQAKTKPWFAVRDDLDKVRAKLAKDNYVKA